MVRGKMLYSLIYLNITKILLFLNSSVHVMGDCRQGSWLRKRSGPVKRDKKPEKRISQKQIHNITYTQS